MRRQADPKFPRCRKLGGGPLLVQDLPNRYCPRPNFRCPNTSRLQGYSTEWSLIGSMPIGCLSAPDAACQKGLQAQRGCSQLTPSYLTPVTSHAPRCGEQEGPSCLRLSSRSAFSPSLHIPASQISERPTKTRNPSMAPSNLTSRLSSAKTRPEPFMHPPSLRSPMSRASGALDGPILDSHSHAVKPALRLGKFVPSPEKLAQVTRFVWPSQVCDGVTTTSQPSAVRTESSESSPGIAQNGSITACRSHHRIP